MRLLLLFLALGSAGQAVASDPALPEELLRQAMQLEKNAFQLKTTAQRRPLIDLYRRAAKAGSPRAQGILASICNLGEYGVKQNEKAALELARSAANAGDPLGAIMIATYAKKGEKLYEKSISVLSSAFDSLVQQAQSGDARAALVLSRMYLDSLGVPKDLSEALKWGRLSAQTLPIGAFVYGTYLGDGIGQNPDLPKAIEQFEKAALGGVHKAAIALMFAYAGGKGVPKSIEEVKRWAQVAADLNHPNGHTVLAHMYINGIGVEKDAAKAAQYYALAAEKNERIACYNLGIMYENGEGQLKQDFERAALWYRKAAEQGHPKAQCNLGWQYQNGKGVQRSLSEAEYWHRKAAKNGEPIAQCNLARLLANSGGDMKEAMQWMAASAAQGHAPAIQVMNRLSLIPPGPRIGVYPTEADIRYQAELETHLEMSERQYRQQEDRYIRGY
ncbi:MAG: sel1 repeat family protein [bacterium]|nr:sel1 repeat family protein [bacterium]